MKRGKALGFLLFSVVLAVLLASGTVGQELPPAEDVEEISQIESDNFSLFYVEREQASSLVGFVVENEPPYVSKVELDPPSPGLNEDIIIKATVENDARRTTNNPLEAKLYYSTDDGGTWDWLEMERAEGSRSLWTAVIPGLDEPARVKYFFTAVDDTGNALIELPAGAVAGGNLTSEDFPGSVHDEREYEGIVKDDLDILGARVWYDGDRLHFGLRVAGAISGGSITPFYAHIYSVGIYYPRKLPKSNERTDLLLVYAENAPFIHLPKVVLLNSDQDFNQTPSAEPQYSIDDGWLFLSFRDEPLEGGRFDSLRVVLGTSYSTGFRPMFLGMGLSSLFNIVPADTTPFMNLVLTDRSFEALGR